MTAVAFNAQPRAKGGSDIHDLELTIMMPCLNEAETIAACVKRASEWLRLSGVAGEVLVADNGSVDGSQALAAANGARIVAIAEQGYLVAVVPVPFNLAILGSGAAAAVMDDHPDIGSWVVGGHSLGGVAASMFIDGNEGLVDGLVLWASYATADLSEDGILVSLAYGTLDAGVLDFTDPDNLEKLGPAVDTVVIEGGNHEQMGWYTGQPNDPPATISRGAQQDAIVEATVVLLAALDVPPLE